MWRWYQEAHICYAFLSDAHSGDESSFASNKWFTRGWTLQEMIALDHVNFYDQNWSYLGSRISLTRMITTITGVDNHALTRGHLDSRSVTHGQVFNYDCNYCQVSSLENVQSVLKTITIAQRMKWASRRQTTRLEDIAYSLLGLSDVHMPLPTAKV